MDVLSIQNLQKSFGDKQVLRGVDLNVPEKSVFGFVGRNGAGKTTTMKAVLGLLKIDAGDIFVAGERVAYGQTPTNRNVGYLPDVPEFYSFMTAKEYLTLCGESLELSASLINKRSEELLSLVGLDKENHRIKGYSRGMKQRLGIAQALLGQPKLLICDEPTSALDPIGRKDILDIIQSVKEQTTVLFSTHILSDVEKICTDVAFLNDGKIVQQGKVAQLKNVYYAHEFVIEFIKEEDGEKVLETFDKVRQKDKNSLIFQGGEDRMLELMRYVADSQIPVSKIERIEPSMETLFLEVASK